MTKTLTALVLCLVILGVAASAEAQCPTPPPGPDWVCVNGGWLPPGHPGIPALPTLPTVPPGVKPAPTVPGYDRWVFAGEPFKVLFDHDGVGVEGFYLDINGTTHVDISVTALLDRTVTVNFAEGLPEGSYAFVVLTYTAGGVVTARSDPYQLQVKPRSGSGAATSLRIIR